MQNNHPEVQHNKFADNKSHGNMSNTSHTSTATFISFRLLTLETKHPYTVEYILISVN